MKSSDSKNLIFAIDYYGDIKKTSKCKNDDSLVTRFIDNVNCMFDYIISTDACRHFFVLVEVLCCEPDLHVWERVKIAPRKIFLLYLSIYNDWSTYSSSWWIAKRPTEHRRWQGTACEHCCMVQVSGGKILCDGINKLVYCYDKCFNLYGDYLEMLRKKVTFKCNYSKKYLSFFQKRMLISELPSYNTSNNNERKVLQKYYWYKCSIWKACVKTVWGSECDCRLGSEENAAWRAIEFGGKIPLYMQFFTLNSNLGFFNLNLSTIFSFLSHFEAIF